MSESVLSSSPTDIHIKSGSYKKEPVSHENGQVLKFITDYNPWFSYNERLYKDDSNVIGQSCWLIF